MTSPKRNARKDQILSPSRTFFATTKTSMGRPYIAQNPVRAGLVDSPEKFPYCFTYLAKRKPAGASPLIDCIPAAQLKLCPVTEHGGCMFAKRRCDPEKCRNSRPRTSVLGTHWTKIKTVPQGRLKDVCDQFSRPLRDWTHLLLLPRTSYGATFTPSLRDCCALPVRYPASLPMVLGECFRCCPN